LFEKIRDRTLLEVGCGTGFLAHTMCPYARRVYGIDISEENLRAAGRSVPDAVFFLGDARCMPLSDGAVDVVSCCELLEHLTDYREGLTELDRVLRPGGLLLLTFPIRPQLPTTRLLAAAADRLNEHYFGKDHAQVHKHLLNMDEVKRELVARAYEVVDERRIVNTLGRTMQEFVRILAMSFFLLRHGGRTQSLDMASHLTEGCVPLVRVWKAVGLPVARLLNRVDSLFDGFDSGCAVILAGKRAERRGDRPGSRRAPQACSERGRPQNGQQKQAEA
jgi:SAM-dependent methyltransferase